jgi:hypothetical protein
MQEQYEVYFEIYGKKLRTTVTANSQYHAGEIIKDRIIIHKVVKLKSGANADSFNIDDLKNMFSMK